MREEFVQAVWAHRRYNPQLMRTTDGLSVIPIRSGVRNQEQGPDFLQAELIIGDTRWAGHVEVHVNGLDWYYHGHHLDAGYNSVIAHVVWIPTGRPVLRQDGTVIPEIVLAEFADQSSIRGFHYLHESRLALPCGELIGRVPLIHRMAAFQSYGTERILAKTEILTRLISRLHGDWEEAFWITLAGAWGGSLNRDSFEKLAALLPLKLIRQVTELRPKEALLLGMTGLLNVESSEPDVIYLKSEWAFLSHKFQLKPLASCQFKFGGLRPAQFPTLRLAQLAALLHQSHRLDILLESKTRLVEVLSSLRPSSFWINHYTLHRSSKPLEKVLGKQFIQHLLINAVAPIRWVYANHVQRKVDSGVLSDFLNELPPENNRITRLFSVHGVNPETSLETQAMLHLFKEYCSERRCLDCQIGHFVLRSFKNSESS